ncbi:hypothetical protein GCM10027271_55470 [Saccharopolyspora gloriosae]|uniref:Uncharacterized protein n=1 Tax=Saccharopolyspora gloriosae TaxID=455344 RepID=A0A840NFR4_9PSEU|nr:hypothetical protein [Saccharopolyspora gloriosae]MBB5068925.1 hypothetical protein [Saccharopolyspora gloriosae]
MPTPGFPPGTLDADDRPIWLSELDVIGHSTAHLVRDVAPRAALELLGLDAGSAVPCTLPAQSTDEHTSLPRAALGDPDCVAVLLAGRVHGWTLVFDDAGATSEVGDLERARAVDAAAGGDWSGLEAMAGRPRPAVQEPSAVLSAAGGPAVTIRTNFTGPPVAIGYAIDGELVFSTDSDDLDLRDPQPRADVRAAIAAAGISDEDDLAPGEPDTFALARIGCALAGVTWTLPDLRATDLIALTFN